MTKPQRRDHNTVNGSVITGLRLESDTAKLLCAAARERAVNKRGKGDVAQMARYFVRTGLGYTPERSNELEDAVAKPTRLCGLALETEVMTLLESRAKAGVTSMARHLIRLGLGFSVTESQRREARFAALAEALREIREAP